VSLPGAKGDTPCRILRPSSSIERDKRGVAIRRMAESEVSFIEQIGNAGTRAGLPRGEILLTELP
jgi:hypothetical protein